MSASNFGIGLGGYLHVVGLPLGIIISGDELFFGDGGSCGP